MRKVKREKKIKAVMTVETSLILPIFIMLFINLLSVIEVYRIHSSVTVSLWEEGRKTAEYLYLKDVGEEAFDVIEEIDSSQIGGLLTSLSGRSRIIKDLENYPIWKRIVNDGKNGFLVSGKTEESGIVSIDCSYRIHPLFVSLTPVSKELKNHYYGHAWTGYELDGGRSEQEEPYVYITETGTVYHKNRGCSYLNPSIQSVSAAELGNLRNKGGAIYYVCPLCDDHSEGTNYYITDYGTNYHRSINCSGLKRTIYEVKLSEVGGKSACSKCGG